MVGPAESFEAYSPQHFILQETTNLGGRHSKNCCSKKPDVGRVADRLTPPIFSDGSDIKFTTSEDGDPFGAETNLSDSSGFSTLPQIAASGSNVFVIWEDRTSDSSGDILIKASSDSGLTFSSGAGAKPSSAGAAGKIGAGGGARLLYW